eukprot:snap_masked-scaffold_1-processed-gene-28.12-mRNA-1 protein AED:1.00 eAED:1.00 QI:0/0/0/0/1/1/2/0/65
MEATKALEVARALMTFGLMKGIVTDGDDTFVETTIECKASNLRCTSHLLRKPISSCKGLGVMSKR